MNFINAFLIGGFICFIGQILMDKFKLLPLHITVLFVVVGSVLEAFNVYDYFNIRFKMQHTYTHTNILCKDTLSKIFCVFKCITSEDTYMSDSFRHCQQCSF